MEMKRGVLGGAIAGFVAAIVNLIVAFILGVAGFIGITEPIPTEELFSGVSTVTMMGAIFLIGILYGVLYTCLSPVIPGEELIKGVYYGLMLWVMVDLVAATIMITGYGAIYMAVDFIVAGGIVWPIYGLVLVKMLERIEE